MRMTVFIPVIILVACNSNETKNLPVKADTLKTMPAPGQVIEKKPEAVIPASKIYFNKGFRDVTVEKIGANKFRIKGQGQIFEANFNWIVEDGHEELKKGFQMTDAGAPEWGKFEFIIEVQKKREHSTLMLILFESSAMDGSRQHELPIVLD
jgi:hypothetical protein